MLLFIRVNLWTTGKGGAVLCSRCPRRGGGCAGGCQSPVLSGGAAAKQQVCVLEKNIFDDTNILLLFYRIK